MSIFKAIWNWRRNARERERRLSFVEDYISSETNMKRVIYQCQIRESSRMKAMG